ncbi:MAG: glycosyltransferase [Anaerolineae bacterium]
MDPAVSVIVTSYNYARYIRLAIESVLNQTYHDFEVIVVDDGSTDETRSILEGLGDRVTCLFQANQGKSAALNRGIQAARGRYVAFLDSDDLWLPDALARRVAVFEADPQVGVVYSHALVIDAEGRPLPQTIGAPARYPGQTLRSLLSGNYIPFATFAVRRSCLDRVGAAFDPKFGATNDWELYLRLSRVCRFHYIDQPTACWRLHGQNWSGNAALMAEQMERVVERALAEPDLPAEVQRSRPVIYRNLYTNTGVGHLAASQWGAACHAFGRAIRVSRNPPWALARILYLVLVRFLEGSRLGAALVAGAARCKQRLNYAAASQTRERGT